MLLSWSTAPPLFKREVHTYLSYNSGSATWLPCAVPSFLLLLHEHGRSAWWTSEILFSLLATWPHTAKMALLVLSWLFLSPWPLFFHLFTLALMWWCSATAECGLSASVPWLWILTIFINCMTWGMGLWIFFNLKTKIVIKLPPPLRPFLKLNEIITKPRSRVHSLGKPISESWVLRRKKGFIQGSKNGEMEALLPNQLINSRVWGFTDIG